MAKFQVHAINNNMACIFIVMSISRRPVIGIIMGSSSDGRIMKGAAKALDDFGVRHEDQIVSAHRTPARLAKYAAHAEKMGFRAIIAGAGGAAHLPGMIASFTVIPVIGVPILVYNDKCPDTDGFKFSAFGGLDSLLSISEMPSGSPVATMGINKSANAGIYAVKILAMEFPQLKKRLMQYKSDRYDSVLKESEMLKKSGLGKFAPG